MTRVDGKAFLRRVLGVFLLLVTVGLATCQSVVNSFAASERYSLQPPSTVARG